jgi:hypothetical protein
MELPGADWLHGVLSWKQPTVAMHHPKSGSQLIADAARIVGICWDADNNPSSFGPPIG